MKKNKTPLIENHIALISFLAVVSALFTWWAVRHSVYFGTDGIPPFFDDANYMADGARRLETFELFGFWKFIASYFYNPPHAPLSSGLAIVSFILFGLNDWSAYAVNGVILFLFLLTCAFVLRKAHPILKIICFFWILVIPLANDLVMEFRPDFAVAVFITAGVILIYELRTKELPFAEKVLIGLCFGLALLTKPSAFPFTLIIFGLGFTLFGPIGRNLYSILIGLLIAAPHYALEIKNLFMYIAEHVFGGSAHIWSITGGPLVQANYYLAGNGGKFLFGICVYIFWPLFFGGLVASFHRKCSDLWRLTFILLVSYLIPTFASSKNVYFGATFQMLGIYMAMILAQMYWDKLWTKAACLIVLLVSVFSFQRIGTNSYESSYLWKNVPTKSHTIISNQIIESIENYIPEEATEKSKSLLKWKTVYVANTGIPNPARLQWVAAKRRLPLRFVSLLFDPNPASAIDFIESQADFVVSSDPNVSGIVEKLPNAQVNDEILKKLKTNPRLRLISKLSDGSDGNNYYYVFQKIK